MDLKSIVEMNKTLNVSEIAEKLGISYQAIYARMKKAGIKPVRQRKLKEPLEVVHEHYQAGRNIKKTAAHFNIAAGHLHHLFKEAGLDTNIGLPGGKRLPSVEVLLQELEHLSALEVAAKYEVSRSAVYMYLRRNNHPISGTKKGEF